VQFPFLRKTPRHSRGLSGSSRPEFLSRPIGRGLDRLISVPRLIEAQVKDVHGHQPDESVPAAPL
jgi:hypothetical protein